MKWMGKVVMLNETVVTLQLFSGHLIAEKSQNAEKNDQNTCSLQTMKYFKNIMFTV